MDSNKAARFRATSNKKTETYPFRYNTEQRRLLHFASEVSGQSMQSIIEDHLWEDLEELYGRSVPVKAPTNPQEATGA